MTIKNVQPQKNIAIPQNIWHRLRVFCAERKFIMKWFVTEAIEEKMQRVKDEQK